MWKRVGIWFAIAFPPLLGAAMVWYTWPRADVRPGGVIVTANAALQRDGSVAMGICWLGALLLLLARLISRKRQRSEIWTWLILVVATAAVLVTPHSSHAETMFAVVSWGLRIGWVAAMLFLLSLFARKAHRAPGVYAGLILLAYPVAALYGVGSSGIFSRWSDFSHVHMADGKTYHVQHCWETDALTEEASKTRLFLRTRVIGIASVEYCDAMLVRPKGVAQYRLRPEGPYGGKADRRLVTTRDNSVIASIYRHLPGPGAKEGCATNLAYDLRSRIFYGVQNLDELSPFILVGPRDELEATDVDALVLASRKPEATYAGIVPPKIAVLEREAGSSNRHVQKLVARLLQTRQREGKQ
jgi:hypothetical protein